MVDDHLASVIQGNTRVMEFFRKVDRVLALTGSSGLHNEDLVPVPVSRRLWGLTGYLGYWGICSLCVTTWSTGSSLLSLGLNGANAMGIVVLSHFFISVAAILNSGYGSEYHVGYSVFQRIIFGIRGSWFGILLRAILSVVWFASQAWLGGLCVNVVLCSWSKSYLDWENTLPANVKMTSQELCGFIVYLALSFPFLIVRPEFLDYLLAIGSFAMFFVAMGITIWAVQDNDGGYGTLMNAPMALGSSQKAWAWLNGLSIWYSAMTSGIANQSDFSRFNKTEFISRLGIFLGCNLFGFIVPMLGIISASALSEKYGVFYWMPNSICMLWLQTNYSSKARAAAFFSGVSLVTSQLAINCIGNGISGGMDLAALFPRYINIRRGAIIVFVLAWPTQPWLFYNSSSVFLQVMSSFSVFITPLIAVFVTDYYVIRKRIAKISDCYISDSSSIYWFYHGVNFRSIVAFLIGVAPGLPGLINTVTPTIHVNTGIKHFYYGSFVFQFVVAAVAYYIINLVFKVEVGERDTVDYYNTYNEEECIKRNMEPYVAEIINEADNSTDSNVISLSELHVKQKS